VFRGYTQDIQAEKVANLNLGHHRFFLTCFTINYDNILRRMRSVCWIKNATDTHPEYIIFIAFPLQQLLQERALMLRYTYIACLAYLWCTIYYS